jgi:hypothetical protein
MKTCLAAWLILAPCGGAFAEGAALEFPRLTIDPQPLSLLDAARDRLPPVFSVGRPRAFVPPPDVIVDASKVRQELAEKLKHPQDLPRM